MKPAELPPTTSAPDSHAGALLNGLTMAGIGLILRYVAQNMAIVFPDLATFASPVVGYLAASLFVAAAGLVSAGLTGQGRRFAAIALEHAGRPAAENPEADGTEHAWRRIILSALRVSRAHLSLQMLAGWPQVLAAVGLAALAFVTVFANWGAHHDAAPNARALQAFGGLLIFLAFPLLVLERVYANASPRVQPDAPQIERLLRVPLASFVGLGATSVLLSLGFEWPSAVEQAIAILIALIALELVVRGLALVFVPFAPIGTRHAVADSTLAGLLRLTPPTFGAVGAAVKRQFGIDLARSWAAAFVRRTALPVGMGMAVFAWCLTGVTALSINERAVYEEFGAPRSVFGPGLHVHLPWPFGIMHKVELGVVHEIPIVFAPRGVDSGGAEALDLLQPATGAEGPAPAGADRLWDQEHPSEASYLVAGEAQGKQSFQVVNVDMRVVYRVGLSATAARQAAYAVADPEALIRAITGRLLVRYFARYTLFDVLGQSRERFTTDFREELQQRLQELATGIDVIAVVVEAIHPPAAAASAYHSVQAAEILAQSEISLRKASAIESVKAAEQNATETRNNATAASAEVVSRAQAGTVLFKGDRQAYAQDRETFLFERWLERLTVSLPKSSFILLDHRLNGAAAPTIDLREFDAFGSAYRADAPVPANPSPPNDRGEGP